MKKSLVALAILLMFLLCGCQASEKADDLDYGDAFSKVQTIAVISPDTLEVIETITDAEDIQNFTQALDVGQWELASLPDHASKLGTFGLSQQKTIQLLDTTPRRNTIRCRLHYSVRGRLYRHRDRRLGLAYCNF